MRASAILVSLGMTLALACATAADRRGGSLVLGPCDRGAQDNPTNTACLMKELDRLASVVERYVQETRSGLRATAATAAADGSSHEAANYTAAAEQLDVAQSLWVAFREAHCTMSAKQVNGSGAGAAPYRCKVQLTYDRLNQISESGFVSSPDPASVAQLGVAANRDR